MADVPHHAHQDCVSWARAESLRNTRFILSGICSIVINGECWASAEVCTLVNALLVLLSFQELQLK